MFCDQLKSACRASSRRIATVAVLGTVGAFSWGGPAWAATTRRVSTTGSDVGDCSIKPCQTIGYAVGRSLSGDTIDIARGTYTEHVTVDKSLVLRGAGMGSTVVDGSHSGTVFTIGSSAVSVAVSISGLTIHHGEPASAPNLTAGIRGCRIMRLAASTTSES